MESTRDNELQAASSGLPGKSSDWGSADGSATPLALQTLTVSDWATIRNTETDANLRANVAQEVTKLVARLTTALLGLIGLVAVIETALIYAGKLPATDRLVNSQVLIALVIAIAAKAGFAFVAMVIYLFPRRAKPRYKDATTTEAVSLGETNPNGLH